jgi:release factor glutamine methyltransferase
MKARTLVDDAVKVLKAAPAIDHWQKGRERIEAEELLIHVYGGDEPDPTDKVSEKKARRFRELVERRATGEPIPYIKGYTEFRGLELLVEPGMFVPRDSSEFLAEQAVRRLRKRTAPVYVDLATGGGTIALAVADEVPKATVYGTDIAEDSIDVARRNARRLKLKVKFLAGDLFGALPRKLAGVIDVITLHPPYVAREEMHDLPDEIKDWEPTHTLTDHSEDGLGLLSRAVEESPGWLQPKGWLLVEVSPDRSRAVKKVFQLGGFRDVEITRGGDLQVTRVIVGRRPR